MQQVQTRGGLFGPGGYGGGIFDGSNMGFGGLGAADSRGQCVRGLGVFPPPSQYPNGYPTSTYTIKSGDTGSKIASLITGNANRWPELVTANPALKSEQYGIALPRSGSIKLPASWVATGGAAAPAPAPSSPAPSGSFSLPAGVSPDDWKSMVQGFQFIVNDILDELGYSGVRFDGVPDATLCGATDFIAKAISSGARPGSGQSFADALREPVVAGVQFGGLLTAACRAVPGWVTPVKAGGGGVTVPPPRPAPPPPPPPAEDDESNCWVEFRDSNPQIRKLQGELNAALDREGYEGIAVTGTYDPATCGAVFVLKGSFKPTPATGCSQFVIPLECPEMDLPKKKGGGEKSGFSTAWMLGGLAVAGAIAGAVALKKKR